MVGSPVTHVGGGAVRFSLLDAQPARGHRSGVRESGSVVSERRGGAQMLRGIIPPHFDTMFARSTVMSMTQCCPFKQDAVLIENYVPPVRRMFERLGAMAGDGSLSTFVEAGFFIAATRGGEVFMSDVVTSLSAYRIYWDTLAAALGTFVGVMKQYGGVFFGDTNANDVLRFQFYHTHPMIQDALEISPDDIDCTLEHLIPELTLNGITAAVDMHAMPYGHSFLGEMEWASLIGKERLRKRFDPFLLRATIAPDGD